MVEEEIDDQDDLDADFIATAMQGYEAPVEQTREEVCAVFKAVNATRDTPLERLLL